MKKKFRLICLIFALISVFLFSSCSSTSSIPERYVEAVLIYKNSLKDPSSMRIYGDIVVASIAEQDGQLISIICDAKNSYGGYSGKKEIEILLSTEFDPLFFDEDSEYFIGIRDTYEMVMEQTDEEIIEQMNNLMTFELYRGEDMAKAIGAEYFEA